MDTEPAVFYRLGFFRKALNLSPFHLKNTVRIALHRFLVPVYQYC